MLPMLQSRLAGWVLASGNGPSPTVLSGTTLADLVLVSLALVAIFAVLSWLHPHLPGSAAEATAKRVEDGSPPQLLMPAGKTIQAYFERQFDFFREGFQATSSSIFRFKLFRSDVIALSGDEARRTFFREKGLNLYEGFQVLVGTIPTGLDPQQLNSIYKRLSVIQKPDNLQYLIPQLFSDCRRKMDLWGDRGTLDPCSGIHEVTFQMIIRSVSSTEIADDPALVCRLKRLYDIIDSSFRPFSLRFPSLPGPATFQKLWASKTVYSIFKRAVDDRKSSGIRKQDVLQQLLDAGESTMCIVGFMMGLPIAGARSTGTIGTWLILFLCSEPDWMSAVRKEIHTLLSTYARALSSSGPLSGQALVEALSAIPLAAWEYQTPVLDLCIRETLRAAQPHTAVRKNMGPAFTVGPYTIPSHAYVAYPFADTFLNPAYYPDPMRWDPSRSLPRDETFLGWGGGKHICKGQRLATLTLKLVTAYALTRYDLAVVDAAGKTMDHAPVPDWNDFLTCRPKETCRIRYVERPCVVAAA